jgi:rare lipoprotein A
MKTEYLRSGRCGRIARLAALGAGCLALAACAGNVGNANRTPHNSGAGAGTTATKQATPRTATRAHRGARTASTSSGNPLHKASGYSTVGTASWYGADFNGRRTATGETFNMEALTAAHPTLPIPCTVRVTNLANRRSVTVRVNDRGPFVGGRVIDVSARTARTLGFYDRGLAKVKIDYIGPARREATALPQE